MGDAVDGGHAGSGRSPMSRGWAARVPGGCSVCGASFFGFGVRVGLAARVSGGCSVCSVSVSGFGERDAAFARVPGKRSVCSVSVSEFSERDAEAAHRTGQRSVYGASNLQHCERARTPDGLAASAHTQPPETRCPETSLRPTLANSGSECHSGKHDYRKGGSRHRRVSAAHVPSVLDHRAPQDHHSQFDLGYSRTIADIHAAWLAHALTTRPSDRSSAETAVAQLYRLADRPEPEFVWLPSPPAAADLIIAEGLAASVPIAHGMRQSDIPTWQR